MAGAELYIWKAELRADTRSVGEQAECPAELDWPTAGLPGNPACPLPTSPRSRLSAPLPPELKAFPPGAGATEAPKPWCPAHMPPTPRPCPPVPRNPPNLAEASASKTMALADWNQVCNSSLPQPFGLSKTCHLRLQAPQASGFPRGAVGVDV